MRDSAKAFPILPKHRSARNFPSLTKVRLTWAGMLYKLLLTKMQVLKMRNTDWFYRIEVKKVENEI